MTTIKGRTGLGTESNSVRIGLPRGFYPIALVVSDATRRTRTSFPSPSAWIQADGLRAQSLPTGRNRVCERLSTPIYPFRAVGSCRNSVPARPEPYR